MTTIPIASITVTGPRRAVNPAKVREIAESIAAVGLLNPVSVVRDESLHAGQ